MFSKIRKLSDKYPAKIMEKTEFSLLDSGRHRKTNTEIVFSIFTLFVEIFFGVLLGRSSTNEGVL